MNRRSRGRHAWELSENPGARVEDQPLHAADISAPRLDNSILTEFGGNAVSIDTKSAIHLTNGVLDLRDNL